MTETTASIPIHQIDFAQANLIAGAFLDAPVLDERPIVRAAYADLGVQADRWFERLTTPGGRSALRVVYTRAAEPYTSGQELAERVRAERTLELCPARYDRVHPVLDMSVGGAYDRFRAVHDIVSHAFGGFGFDRHGEFSAWLGEHRMYHGLARWALATELHAEHSVLWTTGSLAEHKATVLPPRLLERSRQRAANQRGSGADVAPGATNPTRSWLPSQ